uniref:Uncharacterized protein n=1 Tax=Physcomitrium patens TaxID=3218 RepID=A0A2K1ITD3_PHYPA|nr:hypothetical protein PHYPA_024477 [Physcomitrium patens]
MILFRGGLTLPLSLSFSLSGSLWLHFLWCVPLGVWLEFAVGFFALSFCLLSIAKKGVPDDWFVRYSCVGPTLANGSRRRSRLDGMMWCVGLCDVGDPFFCGCRRDFAHPNLSRCCGLEKLWKSCLGKIREFVFEVTLFDRSRIHCTRPPEFAPGTPRSAKAGRGALVQRGLLHMLAYVNIRSRRDPWKGGVRHFLQGTGKLVARRSPSNRRGLLWR